MLSLLFSSQQILSTSSANMLRRPFRHLFLFILFQRAALNEAHDVIIIVRSKTGWITDEFSAGAARFMSPRYVVNTRCLWWLWGETLQVRFLSSNLLSLNAHFSISFTGSAITGNGRHPVSLCATFIGLFIIEMPTKFHINYCKGLWGWIKKKQSQFVTCLENKFVF